MKYKLPNMPLVITAKTWCPFVDCHWSFEMEDHHAAPSVKQAFEDHILAEHPEKCWSKENPFKVLDLLLLRLRVRFPGIVDWQIIPPDHEEAIAYELRRVQGVLRGEGWLRE